MTTHTTAADTSGFPCGSSLEADRRIFRLQLAIPLQQASQEEQQCVRHPGHAIQEFEILLPPLQARQKQVANVQPTFSSSYHLQLHLEFLQALSSLLEL